MTLLQQIQGEAVDGSSDLGSLLRRCRILAQRLGVEEFKDWVVCELDGYPSIKGLPKYRIIGTPLHLGTFNGRFGRRIENAQIPLSSVPERIREFVKELHFTEGVASIQELVRSNPNGVRIPWPADVIRFVGQGDIYTDFFLIQALRIVGLSVICGILDQIRNRILNFALELESRNPETGEPIMNSPKIPSDQVSNIFHTTIKGDVQNLAQSSRDFSQVAQSNVAPHDMESLRGALSQLGLEKAEIAGLEAAIKKDNKSGAAGMGDGVKAWLGAVAMKVAEGTVSIASEAGATAIAEALKRYFGS